MFRTYSQLFLVLILPLVIVVQGHIRGVTPFHKLKLRPEPIQSRMLSANSLRNVTRIQVPFNPEWKMSPVQIIEYRGYPAQVHSVVTEDGYILQLQRIPHGRFQTLKDDDNDVPTGKPVLLAHAFGSSSLDFILAPSSRSLAFLLADRGYDVWMSNMRGNIYSRNHTKLNINSEEFWDFSWDEMGRYDIPAVINFILAKTGHSKLTYIGASMGTTVFFVAMASHPELNDKIDAMFALGPVASLSATRDFHYTFIGNFLWRPLAPLLERRFRNEPYMDPESPDVRTQNSICNLSMQTIVLCANLIFLRFGFDPANWDAFTFAALVNQFPKGTSFRTMDLYFQNYFTGRSAGPTFVPYDFGPLENLNRYGQTSPPPYDLSKVTAPVYLFISPNDFMSSLKDVDWLASKLANVKDSIIVDHRYNHMDFLWASNVDEKIFARIFSLIPPP